MENSNEEETITRYGITCFGNDSSMKDYEPQQGSKNV